MDIKPVPCRVFVILARTADKAVILRRGPHKWTRLILWDTKAFTFEEGQWFKGRIYHYQSDLSPDGSLFIYFAAKINSHTLRDKEFTHTWTAISKPPYFTALALWPKGDFWSGGGLFNNDRVVWLNHPFNISQPHPQHRPQGLKIISNPDAHVGGFSVFFRRLERDGWIMIKSGVDKQSWYAYATTIFHIPVLGKMAARFRKPWHTHKMAMPHFWQKSSHDQKTHLIMRYTGGREAYEYSVRDDRKNLTVPIEGATWADWDRNGRLVFVREGQLFAVEPDMSITDAKLLRDFNDQKPEPMEAPDWAKQW